MSGYTFPKNIRLRKKREIDHVFTSGSFRGLGLIRVKYLPTELEYSRYLVSVSKAAGHSPFRNRTKRLIREVIRLNNPKLKGSYDICVFVTKCPQTPVTFSYVEAKIVKLFAELNRLSKTSMV